MMFASFTERDASPAVSAHRPLQTSMLMKCGIYGLHLAKLRMASVGSVRSFDADEGWGVIEAPDVPGGCLGAFRRDRRGWVSSVDGRPTGFVPHGEWLCGCADRLERPGSVLIKLRSWPDRLPAPEQFLTGVADTIIGTMPPGWVHRQLAEGRGLLLVDGVDQLQTDRRPTVRTWLEDLLDTYPESLVGHLAAAGRVCPVAAGGGIRVGHPRTAGAGGLAHSDRPVAPRRPAAKPICRSATPAGIQGDLSALQSTS
jgi:hypothetical protein